MKRQIGLAFMAATVILGPGRLGAQNVATMNAAQLFATRAELEAMLSKFDGQTQVTAYSDAVRSIAKDEADLIRIRLRDGDFEVGDQIMVTVSGQVGLSSTFSVQAGRLLVFPEIGGMPVGGLLRSELPDSMKAFIGRYIRDPQVFIQTSMRLQAVGEIGNPGYQLVTAEARLPDVIAQIGQPSKSADLDAMKIKRGKETIWDGDALQEAIIQGRTMDQMSLRAGDIIEIPAQKKRNLLETIRGVYYLIPLSVFVLSRF